MLYSVNKTNTRYKSYTSCNLIGCCNWCDPILQHIKPMIHTIMFTANMSYELLKTNIQTHKRVYKISH